MLYNPHFSITFLTSHPRDLLMKHSTYVSLWGIHNPVWQKLSSPFYRRVNWGKQLKKFSSNHTSFKESQPTSKFRSAVSRVCICNCQVIILPSSFTAFLQQDLFSHYFSNFPINNTKGEFAKVLGSFNSKMPSIFITLLTFYCGKTHV